MYLVHEFHLQDLDRKASLWYKSFEYDYKYEKLQGVPAYTKRSRPKDKEASSASKSSADPNPLLEHAAPENAADEQPANEQAPGKQISSEAFSEQAENEQAADAYASDGEASDNHPSEKSSNQSVHGSDSDYSKLVTPRVERQTPRRG
jgi:hypothetical protein